MNPHLLEKARLLSKVPSDTLSEEEKLLLKNWIEQDKANKDTLDRLNDLEIRQNDISKLTSFDTHQGWLKLLEKRDTHNNTTKIFVLRWKQIGIVAAIILALSFGSYFLYQTTLETENPITNIKPASNKAILTLQNGETIELDNNSEGLNLQEDSIHAADGQFIKLHALKTNQKLSISTPRGGQYKVILADGTKVWLNSASTLTYPSTFDDSPERLVSVEGEAFFEVTKVNRNHKHIPFVVRVGNQTIRVLGTSFNVQKHKNDANSYTTLVEGAVEVIAFGKQIKLNPGEQAVSSASAPLKKKQLTYKNSLLGKKVISHFRMHHYIKY